MPRRSQARLATVDDAKWDSQARLKMDGKVMWEAPLGDMLFGFLLDAIHHRGQLSSYLRPMGAKVPSIYGPSADDPGDVSGSSIESPGHHEAGLKTHKAGLKTRLYFASPDASLVTFAFIDSNSPRPSLRRARPRGCCAGRSCLRGTRIRTAAASRRPSGSSRTSTAAPMCADRRGSRPIPRVGPIGVKRSIILQLVARSAIRRLVGEVGGLDDQRVAFPAAARVAHVLPDRCRRGAAGRRAESRACRAPSRR